MEGINVTVKETTIIANTFMDEDTKLSEDWFITYLRYLATYVVSICKMNILHKQLLITVQMFSF